MSFLGSFGSFFFRGRRSCSLCRCTSRCICSRHLCILLLLPFIHHHRIIPTLNLLNHHLPRIKQQLPLPIIIRNRLGYILGIRKPHTLIMLEPIGVPLALLGRAANNDQCQFVIEGTVHLRSPPRFEIRVGGGGCILVDGEYVGSGGLGEGGVVALVDHDGDAISLEGRAGLGGVLQVPVPGAGWTIIIFLRQTFLRNPPFQQPLNVPFRNHRPATRVCHDSFSCRGLLGRYQMSGTLDIPLGRVGGTNIMQRA
mmetsp:Transcript_5321/g.8378  ORF Transcript_5321/g.8378 Transcript_5321/m.8378 type:complete len:254 (-) Transcript_5321:99-860(-)